MTDLSEAPKVEDLVSPVTKTGQLVEVIAANGLRMQVDSSVVTSYNFRQPGFLSQKDTSQLAALHQKFAADLSARLATYLRMDVVLAKSSVSCASTTFRSFCDALAVPTHLTVFQIEGLEGAGVLDMRPLSSIALANRLLGGKGVAPEGDRSPTEIEIALLDEIAVMILKEWCSLFERSAGKRPAIVGHESSCRFLQIASDDTSLFVFKVDLSVGDLKEVLQIAVPFSLMDGLTHETGIGGKAAPEIKQKPLHWRSPYAMIEVPITAVWDVRDITLGEAAGLSVGDLIHLPQELIDQTKLSVSETEEFYGTIGVEEGRLAVHLNERISKE
jgi:flagellar motor switch protein FliM